MKVLIFGIGNMYYRYKHYFENMEIVGFVDNNPDTWGNYVDGICVYEPNLIRTLSFDYIFLVSVHYKSMRKQLVELGIDEKRIVDKENKQIFLANKQINTYWAQNSSNIKRNRVLLFSHVLNLSGAPIVFVRLAKILRKYGYDVIMYSEQNSLVNQQSLIDELLENEITIKLYDCFEEFELEDIVEEFEFCIVNTLVLYDIVRKILKTKKKVFWWLHEMEDVYAQLPEGIKLPYSNNLYVLSVGDLVKKAYEKNTGYSVYRNLLYGVPEIEIFTSKPRGSEKVCFALIGYYSERKGQEILFEAIKRNNSSWINYADFYFVGDFPDEKLVSYEVYENVFCTGELSQKEIAHMYEKMDVLLCPSFHDPMPVVVTEAMQRGIFCLISNRVGQKTYIDEGINGLICEADSVEDLTDKINWILDHKVQIREMGQRSYHIYADNFSMKSFEANVLDIFNIAHGETTL